MRIIDADDMKRLYQEVLCSHVSCIDCSFFMVDGSCKFETMLSEAPTVDAVPVIRCKDCKYCDVSLVLPTGRKMYNCMEGSHDHQTLLKLNDFCSRGERRKDREYIDSEKKGGEEE